MSAIRSPGHTDQFYTRRSAHKHSTGADPGMKKGGGGGGTLLLAGDSVHSAPSMGS